MADTLKPGDRINITIEAAEVTERGAFLVAKIHPPEGNPSDPFPTEVPIGWSNVTVERADPEWWPPRPADVLRHTPTGRLWFGVAHASNLCLYCSNGDCMDPQQTWEQRHRLEIVHREEESRG